MFRPVVCVLAGVAMTGIALSPAAVSAASAASAASLKPTVLAYSSTAGGGGDPDTTVTFTVTTGALSLSAPVSVNLGSGAPGTTIAGPLGPVTVTDDRALLVANWTVTAAATDWTTGGSTPAETIPATDVGYDPGSITTTGVITGTGTPVTLANSSAPVVTGTAGVGDNTASWDPTLAVAVPQYSVGGVYTGTLTQSVS